MGTATPPRAGRIVGRDAELEALAGVLAADGAVLLLGEPGVGKSAVAQRLAERSRAAGRRVLEGQADTGGSGVTLGALRDAVRGWLRSGEAAADVEDPLAARLPELLLPELGAVEPAPAERGALFEATVRFARELARPRGALVVLEDLHWADATTLELVPYLLRAVAPERVAVLVTMRPDGVDAAPGAVAMRAELARRRLAAEITLPPLGAPAAAELVARLVGEEPGPAAGPLLSLAAGNPFALEELTAAALESGRLEPMGRGPPPVPVPLPWTLAESIRARASRLAPDAQALLRLAAALGNRFDVRLLAAAADRSVDEVLPALARLTAAGMLRASPGDPHRQLIEFRHALTREALVQDELPAALASLHRTALSAATRLRESGEHVDPGLLAAHAREAGDREAALRHSVDAAEASLRLGGWPEAAGHLATALGLWIPEDGLLLRARLGAARAGILDRMSRDPEVPLLMKRAADDFSLAGDAVSAALADADAAAFRLVAGGAPGDELARLREALSRLGDDAPRAARLRILSHLATAELMRGAIRDALAWTEEGIPLIDGDLLAAEAPDWVELLSARGGALTFLGRQAEGRALQAEAIELARRHGDHLGLHRGLSRMVIAHRTSMSVAEAGAVADEAVTLTRDWGLDAELATALVIRALVDVEGGDWTAADARLAEAGRVAEQLGPEGPRDLLIQRVRAELALGRGEWETAERGFAALAGRASQGGWMWSEIHALAGRGRALLVAGRGEGARRPLRDAVERWAAAGAETDPEAVPALAAAARAGVLGRGETSAQARAVLEAFGEDPRARWAVALVTRRDDRERELEAACVEAAGRGRRPEAAELALLGAEALAHGGSKQAAVALGEQALRGFSELGVEHGAARARAVLRSLGHRPTTRAALAGRAGLTGREREVLALLADGLTNREISERLVLSEATAIRHVSNIFRKLGVHSRAQAVRVGAERGLLGEE